MQSIKKIISSVLIVGFFMSGISDVGSFKIPRAQAQSTQESSTPEPRQTPFISRVIKAVQRTVREITQIPKTIRENRDSSTFANSNEGSENGILFDQSGKPIFNLEALDSIKNLSITGDDFGIAMIPTEQEIANLDSFIVRFKTPSVSERTKQLFDAKGYEIKPGNREEFTREIQIILPQLETRNNQIKSEQNVLLGRIQNTFGGTTRIGEREEKTFSSAGRTVQAVPIRSSLNAVIVSGVSRDEVDSLVQGLDSVASVESARPVQVQLTNTAQIINSTQIQSYLGANGAFLTGEGMRIGIIDTGVDYTHPDLGNCSFLTTGGCKVVYGYDFVNNDPNPMDDHGHGTHVAATAAGKGFYTDANGNPQELFGIAPDATIYAYKVLSASGSGTNLGVVAAINACTDPNGDGLPNDRLDVCSLSLGSLGGDPTDLGSTAADNAVEAGVIMTIAAGNSGPGFSTVGTPGTSRKAITVGAACKPEQIGVLSQCPTAVANFSSRGPVEFTEDGQFKSIIKPDIVAPGVEICAAQWADWMDPKSCLGTGNHISINGTSMATPVVAGLMALLAQAHPEKTVEELKETLMISADSLGLDQNIQGFGFINGFATLENLGIPNSLVAISGLPFFINDVSNSQFFNFSKNLTFQNVKNTAINLSLQNTTNSAGINLSFPNTVSIPANSSVQVPVDVQIDHAIASSGVNLKDTISVTNTENIEETLNVNINRTTPSYLVPETQILNFGLFHNAESVFNKTMTLNLDNRLLDQSLSYDVVIDQFSTHPNNFDNISLTPSAGQITLGPSGNSSLDLTLSAFSNSNNILPNGTYKTIVKFVSPLETVEVEVRFFKGYSFTFEFGSVNPDMVILNGSSWSQGYIPNPALDYLTFYATQVGPYHAMAYYGDQNGSFDRVTGIFKLDINISPTESSPTFPLQKSLAVNRVENNFFGNTCVFKWGLPNGQGFTFAKGGKLAFEYNQVPEDMYFSSMCGNLMTSLKKILLSQIYLAQNINGQFSLNNQTADSSQRFIYGFNNRFSGNAISLGINLCNFANFKQGGSVDSQYYFCSFWHSESGGSLVLEEGQTGVVETKSLHTHTPENAPHPSYPSFKIHARNHSSNPEQDKMFMYTSAEMFATSEHLYAWSPLVSGLLTDAQTTTNTYEQTKIPLVNENFITIGTGPITDTYRVKSFKDEFGIIGGHNNNYISPYRYADGTTESSMLMNPNQVSSRFSFELNGSLLSTNTFNLEGPYGKFLQIPNSLGVSSGSSYGNPAVGNHSVKIERLGMYDGEYFEQDSGVFTTQFDFPISSSTTVDQIPPFFKTIQLVEGGLLQNHLDPTKPGQIRIFVDPGKGISSHSLTANALGAYEIGYMPDSISLLRVFTGDSPTNINILLPSQYVESSDGYYTVDLAGIAPSGNRQYFKIEAEDLSGNTTEYTFYFEVGNSLSLEEVVDENLLVCTINQPTVSFVPGTLNLVSGGDFATAQFSFTNNNSFACGPSSNTAQITFTTYQYSSVGNDSIRGTNQLPLDNTFNSGGFLLLTGALNPSQTVIVPAYFRATQFLPTNNYKIKAVVSGPAISNPYELDFFANVVNQNTCTTADLLPPVATFPSAIYIPSLNSPVSVVTSVVNNNPVGCPSISNSHSITLVPLVASLKVGSNINNVNAGSASSLISSSLGSGQSQNITQFIKATSFFEIVSYSARLRLLNQNQSVIQEAIVPVYVLQSEPEDPVEDPTPPAPLPTYCIADFNQDGLINTADQSLFNAGYGTNNPTFDFNGDGTVNSGDLMIFLGYLGGGCGGVETPSANPVNNIHNDPSITISYEVGTAVSAGNNIYEYQITITNTSNITKTNLVATNLLPPSQVPFAEFTASSIPGLTIDANNTLAIPSLSAGQAITVFITVTIPVN